MGFDKAAPGKGAEVFSQVREGKAEITLTAYLQEEKAGQRVEFQMYDREGQLVLHICRRAEALCQARGLLLYPHLWQSVEEPYLYKVRIRLLEGEEVLEQMILSHGIASVRCVPLKGFMLNEKPFSIQPVSWGRESLEIYDTDSGVDKAVIWKYQERIEKLLDLILEMGANTVCFSQKEIPQLLRNSCRRKGLLVCQKEEERIKVLTEAGEEVALSEEEFSQMPELLGEENHCVLTSKGMERKDSFYYYKACWGKKPFVHLCCCESIRHRGSTITIRVFSNQPKVVLYVEGMVFEYRSGGPEFVFEEVPLKGEETAITVQAAGCCMTTTIFRS